MKKCLFCAEDIQDDALKCRYCGEFQVGRDKPAEEKRPWYFRTTTVVSAILCVAFFALPLVWFNPYYSYRCKVIVTLIVLGVTAVLGMVTMHALTSIQEYYKMLG
ncbi:MAG: zinc ribbon domain-containing protein [Candidatus Omnitrophota bacterium]